MTRKPIPYVDRGKPGDMRYQGKRLLRVTEPPASERVILRLQELRRHNSLQPELMPTHRIFLRWAESGGDGLPDPGADRRELYFDPLPLGQEELVSYIVNDSPWDMLIRKWYRTTLDSQKLADAFCISRTQLYNDWRNALWYFRGRFEEAGFGVHAESVESACTVHTD